MVRTVRFLWSDPHDYPSDARSPRAFDDDWEDPLEPPRQRRLSPGRTSAERTVHDKSNRRRKPMPPSAEPRGLAAAADPPSAPQFRRQASRPDAS